MPPETQKPIDVKLFLLFVPVAFFTYLFHEFGHWSVGEILGNRMVYSLNYVWAAEGHYLHASDDLFVSIGGPGFSILQAAIALLVIEMAGSRYAYPFAFFAMFNRFFSVLLGGFSRQDEARIAALIGTQQYLVAIIVLAILLLITVKSSHRLNIGAKANGYFLTVSTGCQLMVIGTYTWLL